MLKFVANFFVSLNLGRRWEKVDFVPPGIGIKVPFNSNGWWRKKTCVFYEVDNVKLYRLYRVSEDGKRMFRHKLQARYIAIRVIGESVQILGFGCAKGTERVFTPVEEENINYDLGDLIEV
jgi:hypothetical protein